MNLLNTLQMALSYKRPHGSREEATFVAYLAQNLPITLIDGAGNLHVDLRTKAHHRTCFTSHTDTVHQTGGVNTFTRSKGTWTAKDAPLGADDGAGVALMVHMIHNKVPALYIFFRGEEVSGLGSMFLAEEMPEALKDIDRAIALDRAGYHDVITHQAGIRGCSDAFALALSEALTADDMSTSYMPCDKGVFTDTANIAHLVPETTNLSVAYFKQHSNEECLDVDYLIKLAHQLTEVQWDDLPVERTPAPSFASSFGESFGDSFGATYRGHPVDIPDSPLLLALEEAIDEDDQGTLMALLRHGNPAVATERRLRNSVVDCAYEDLVAGTDEDLVIAYLKENLE
jgi:hypothetical protein